jgi:hypothetical protein
MLLLEVSAGDCWRGRDEVVRVALERVGARETACNTSTRRAEGQRRTSGRLMGVVKGQRNGMSQVKVY